MVKYSRLGKAAVLTGALMGGIAGTVLAQEATPNRTTIDFNINSDISGFGYKVGSRQKFNDNLELGLGFGIEVIPKSGSAILSQLVHGRWGFVQYAEVKAGPFVFMGGYNYWNDNKPSLFGELGLEFPMSKDWRSNLRILLGMDTEGRGNFGIGYSIPESK